MKMRQFDEHGMDKNLRNDEIEKASKCAVHPLVTAHPITGRKNIYANPSHTARVNGVSEEESELILSFLFQHSAQAKFLYRHHYQDYDVVIWDNRAVHHRATGCPDEFPRKLIRTTVSNDDEPKEDIPVDSHWDLEKDRVNAEVYTHPTINSSPEL
jgi:alpha-ketoglutarate-dependent taurine dioxygenase